LGSYQISIHPPNNIGQRLSRDSKVDDYRKY
jgi:hypothetical protein